MRQIHYELIIIEAVMTTWDLIITIFSIFIWLEFSIIEKIYMGGKKPSGLHQKQQQYSRASLNDNGDIV